MLYRPARRELDVTEMRIAVATSVVSSSRRN
jgi:hypothetical protein